MPLILEAQPSLPYIDPPVSQSSLDAANALIASELASASGSDPGLHPSIDTSYEPSFSAVVEEAHARLASNIPLREEGRGIDLSRYEEPEAPSSSLDDQNSWAQVLCKAYISQSYLEQRNFNLGLLERYGKNAWLIANAQVEDELLRPVEKELEDVRREIEEVERMRREGQESVKGEIDGLGETWRNTVGRAIEAEIATESLRREVLDRRRAGTSSTSIG